MNIRAHIHIRLALAAAALLAAAGLAAIAASAHPIAPGPAAPVVGIDMVSDASNTATGLGAIDPCLHVDNTPGATFSIDTFLDAVPADLELDGFNYLLYFPAVVTMTDQDHELILKKGAADLSEEVPDPPGEASSVGSPHVVTGAKLSSGSIPGNTRGVLGRYTFAVNPGSADGFSLFAFNASVKSFSVASEAGGDWWFGPDQTAGTQDDRGADIWDGSHSPVYGVLALGSASCSGGLPTPAPTLAPGATVAPASSPGASGAASASATPSGSASASKPPAASGSATATPAPVASTGSGSSFPWLPVVIGAVVALAVIGGGAAFGLRRRRQP